MNLKQHRQNYRYVMKRTTLGIIRKAAQVCLAMKLRGFGAGKWNFSGGKAEEGETTEVCFVRETLEEFHTRVRKVRRIAILYFYFSDVKPEKGWDQKCDVFEAEEWDGEPQRTNEMDPRWWERNEIPYHQMWQADREWIELALDGHTLTGYFLFTSKGECLESQIILDEIIDE